MSFAHLFFRALKCASAFFFLFNPFYFVALIQDVRGLLYDFLIVVTVCLSSFDICVRIVKYYNKPTSKMVF